MKKIFLLGALSFSLMASADSSYINEKICNIKTSYQKQLKLVNNEPALKNIIIKAVNMKSLTTDTFCSSVCNLLAAYRLYLSLLEQEIHWLESVNQDIDPKFSLLYTNLKKILQVAKQIEKFKKIKCPMWGAHSLENRKKLEKTLSQQNK